MWEYKLIEAIKAHPLLYDKTLSSYRCKERKRQAWLEVGRAANENVELCQSRWRTLRDRFVKEMNKKCESTPSPFCTWRYMEAMSFLEDFIERRSDEKIDNPFFEVIECGGDTKSYSGEATFDTNESTTSMNEFNTSDVVKSRKIRKYKRKQPYKQLNESMDTANDVDNKMSQLPESDMQLEECGNESLSRVYDNDITDFKPTVISNRRNAYSKLNTSDASIQSPIKEKRKLSEASDAAECFNKLIDIAHCFACQRLNTTKSRNEDFYKLLDTYMLKLPEQEQDNIKIEILNMVHQKTFSENK